MSHKVQSNIIINLSSSSRVLSLAILMLSIIFPASLQGVKLIMLLAVVFLFVNAAISRREYAKWWIGTLFFASLFSIIGLGGSLYGAILSNPGAIPVLTVVVIYPILFSFLSAQYFPGDYTKLHSFILLTGGLLLISHVLYLISYFGIDGRFIYNLFHFLYGDVAVVAAEGDYFAFTLPSVSSLLFILPYFITYFFIKDKFSVRFLLLLIVMIIVTILPGRRVIYLALGISLICIFLLITIFGYDKRRIFKKLFNRGMIFIIPSIIIFVLAYLNGIINIDIISNDILSIFDFSSNASNLERRYQFNALIKGFFERPIFGNGAGAAAEYTRSLEQPWAYELFYLSILFQYGILNSLLYILGVVFLLTCLVKYYASKTTSTREKEFLLCYLSGMISFLVATSSNPYLAKFDYMWIIFIPVALINCKKVYGCL